jgi:CubicO group peptidase (beta-lactamase class C family)
MPHVGLVVCLAIVVAESWGQSPPTTNAPEDRLIGLWASETRFGPALRGELRIRREDGMWRATLAGKPATCERAETIHCAFPSNLGQFRGTVQSGGNLIDGWWLQPTGETVDRRDPGGAGQSFATLVELQAAGRNEWRGSVQPLEDRFHLYLRVFRDDKGNLLGAFRNPEVNSNGGSSHFQVSRTGDAVHFLRQLDGGKEIRHEATLASSQQRMSISWPDGGGVLTLTRRTPSQAPGFFPRPSGEPKYVYSKPPDTGDGWHTAGAREVAMDEGVLERLVQRLIDADPSARRAALIHSMLVARRGRLVLEEYFFGYGRDTPHDTRSAGKTFSSVMLGAAMMQGVKVGPESGIYELLAQWGPFANPEPRKGQITLAHLMTHTSGLDCDDNNDHSLGNEGTMQSQRQQPNWWKYTLDLPVVHDPGTRYAYCSANTNLVGAALTKATGTWLPELFERTVARPLEFGRYYWNLMPTGEGYQGGGAFVRSRDLLKVGQAYLDGGVWNGKRIVNADWIKLSTTTHAEITPATTGVSAEEFGNYYSLGRDGYTWHLSELQAGDRKYQDYEATGNGGQLLIVVPDAQLVVVFTAGNFAQGGIWSRFRDDIVGHDIIAAIEK